MAKRNVYHYYRIYDDREQFNYIRTSLEEQELRKMLKQFEKKNQEYSDVSLLFSSTSTIAVKETASTSSIDFKNNLGTEYSPIMSDKIGLWQKNGKIFVKWFGDDDSSPEYLCNQSDCTETVMVYDNGSVPTRIGFLPGYNNVIVIASLNKIFAIQAQNYSNKIPQIIYQGAHPDFRINNKNLYIKDNGVFYEIII